MEEICVKKQSKRLFKSFNDLLIILKPRFVVFFFLIITTMVHSSSDTRTLKIPSCVIMVNDYITFIRSVWSYVTHLLPLHKPDNNYRSIVIFYQWKKLFFGETCCQNKKKMFFVVPIQHVWSLYIALSWNMVIICRLSFQHSFAIVLIINNIQNSICHC